MEKDSLIHFSRNKDYRFVKQLGLGATGKTILIKDESIDELFVCKKYSTYNTEFQELYYSNFVDEIKILYKLYHKNIVRVFNYFLYPEKHTGYILMEYIDGINIQEYTNSYPWEINELFVQTIVGFKYLENKKVLHRDIRSTNILVTNEGVVKIIDFGFGKKIKESDDYHNSLADDLNWIATLPDEFEESEYDFQTEIYFIGKLFKNIVESTKSSNSFMYKEVLDRMTKNERTARFDSFEAVYKEVVSSDSKLINFSSQEKMTYQTLADYFQMVCSKMYDETQYIKDYNLITDSLTKLLSASALEEIIQDNKKFINCFITTPYSYIIRPMVPVKIIDDFFKFWQSISEHKKAIVLNNLSNRFNMISREKVDELPF